jgi:anti-anti-sigma regulatory factor
VATDLAIAAHSTETALVVRVTGALAGADGDRGALHGAVSAAPPPALVVLDLSGVVLLSASGVRTVLALVDSLGERGVRCRLVAHGGSPAAAVLAASAVPVLSTVDDALAPVAATAVHAGPGPAPDSDPDIGVLAVELASLTRALLDAPTTGAVLRRVVTAAVHIVPGADLVSVTLRDPTGAFFTPAETDPVAGALDEAQYDSGTGPCIDAARPDGPAYAASDDLATETRWPRFAAAATAHGFAAVFSTDLLDARGAGDLGGALNIYARRPGGLGTRDRHAAIVLASYAALALTRSNATEQAAAQQGHLLRAVENRDVIGQAKGIIMARRGLTADEAFRVLRRTSQDLNIKVVDLARALAARPDGLDTP